MNNDDMKYCVCIMNYCFLFKTTGFQGHRVYLSVSFTIRFVWTVNQRMRLVMGGYRNRKLSIIFFNSQ